MIYAGLELGREKCYSVLRPVGLLETGPGERQDNLKRGVAVLGCRVGA